MVTVPLKTRLSRFEYTAFTLTPIVAIVTLALLPAIRLPSMCVFQQVWGVPCPGCGISRSLGALVRGDLLMAVSSNPAGLVVFPALCLQALVGASTQLGIVDVAMRIRALRYGDVAVLGALLAVWFVRLAAVIVRP